MIPIRDTVPTRRAPVVVWSLVAIKESARELLSRSQTPEKAAELADLLSTGRWTHDYPITADQAREIGLPVSTKMPEEFLQLMSLYPQPVKRQPSVEYLPIPRRLEREQGSPAS